MFQAVRRKFGALKSYRKLRKLWDESVQLMKTEEFGAYGTKLAEFIDNFRGMHSQYVESTAQDPQPQTLDKVYGDCTELLTTMVSWANVHAACSTSPSKSEGPTELEMLTGTLQIAELILREEKYREIAKDLPQVLENVVSLLDKLTRSDHQKLLLLIISSLGSNAGNRLEIGRLDGFRKMLGLLLGGDEEVTKQILKTLRHFLDTHPLELSEEERHPRKRTLSEDFGERRPEQSNATAPPTRKSELQRSHSVVSYRTITQARVAGVVLELSKLAFSELQKMFPTSGMDDTLSKRAGTHADQPRKPWKRQMRATVFPPRRSQLEQILDALANDRPGQSPGDPRTGERSGDQTLDSEAGSSEDVLKELMRVQGALRALTDTLCQSASAVQLELIETISQLLCKNKANQSEFARIGGYSLILQLLDDVPDSGAPTQQFLVQCFQAIATIVLDSNPSKLIGNLDALRWVFHIITNSVQVNVRIQALNMVQDLLYQNPLNAAHMRAVQGIGFLLTQLQTWPSEVPKHPHSSQSELAQEQLKVLVRVDQLLKHLAVIFTRHNLDIPKQYVAITAAAWQLPQAEQEFQLQLHHSQQCVLLASVADLAGHLNLYKLEIVSHSVEVFTLQLRQALDHLSMSLTLPMEEYSPQPSPSPTSTARAVSSSISTAASSGSRNSEDLLRNHHIAVEGLVLRAQLVLTVLAQLILGADCLERVERFDAAGGFRNLIDLLLLIDKQPHTQTQLSIVLEQLFDVALYLLRRFTSVREQVLSRGQEQNTIQESDQDMADDEDRDDREHTKSRSGTRSRGSFKEKHSPVFEKPKQTIPVTGKGEQNKSKEVQKQAGYGPMEWVTFLLNRLSLHYRVKLLHEVTLMLRSKVHQPPSLGGRSSGDNETQKPNNFEHRKKRGKKRKGQAKHIFGTRSTQDPLEAELQRSLKVRFRRTGALMAVVQTMKHAATALELNEGEGPLFPQGQSQSQHQSKSSPLLVSAFLTLAEAVTGCEENKAYLGDRLGFCELADVIQRTVSLEKYVFDVILELSIVGSLKSSPLFTHPVQLTPLEQKLQEVLGNPKPHIEQLASRLQNPPQLFKPVSPPVRKNENGAPVTQHSPEAPAPTQPTHASSSPEGSSGVSGTTSGQSEGQSDCTDPESDSSSSIVGQGVVTVGPASSSGAGAAVPEQGKPNKNVENKEIEKDKEPRVLQPANPAPVPKSEPSSVLGTQAPKVMKRERGKSVQSPVRGFQTSGGRHPLSTIKFRSTEAALMVILLLPHSEAKVQVSVIERLALLLEANPANKRALSQVKVLSTLVRLCPRFSEEVRSYYLQLAAALGLYSITPNEAQLLFELALLPPQHNDPHDLQMQMLLVIARIAARRAPTDYFNLDGSTSSLTLPTLNRFPAPSTGYTLCCWLQVNQFFDSEASLLVWEDASHEPMFELLFQNHPSSGGYKSNSSAPSSSGGFGQTQPQSQSQSLSQPLSFSQNYPTIGLTSSSHQNPQQNSYHGHTQGGLPPPQYPAQPQPQPQSSSPRYLTARTKRGTFVFSKYRFEESPLWHHVAVSHNKTSLTLFVDGELVHTFQGVEGLEYPNATKQNPLTGRVGSSPSGMLTTTSFSGALATLNFFEGVWDGKQAHSVFKEGTLFQGEAKKLGIQGKQFLNINPREFSPQESLLSPNGGSTDKSPMRPRVQSGDSSDGSAPLLLLLDVRDNNNRTSKVVSTSPPRIGSHLPSLLPGSGAAVGDIGANAHPPAKSEEPREELSTFLGFARNITTIAGGLIAGSGGNASPHRGKLEEEDLAAMWDMPELKAEVDVHHTRSIKNEIRHIGGIVLCFPFLLMSQPHQVVGLRILSSLLENSRENTEEFLKAKGFETLCYLLSHSQSDLNREIFDALLDIVTGSVGLPNDKRQFVHPDGLLMVLDLIHRSHDSSSVREVVQSLSQTAISFHHPSNLIVCRNSLGIVGILELVRLSANLKAGLLPSLLAVLEHIFPVCRLEEFELIVNFLVTQVEEPELLAEKQGISHLLHEAMQNREELVTFFLKLGGFDLVYIMLGSPSEPIRIDCVKRLGLIFSVGKNVALFTRQGGYHVLHGLLLRYSRISKQLYAALFELALGKYRCRPAEKPVVVDDDYLGLLDQEPGTSGGPEKSEEPEADPHDPPSRSEHMEGDLAYPMVLQVVLQLLRDSRQPDVGTLSVHLSCMNYLGVILDKTENIDSALDSDWLLWCQTYLEPSDVDEVKVVDPPEIASLKHRVHAKFQAVVTRTLVRDLCRAPRVCKVTKLKDLPETTEFQVTATEMLLEHFTRTPRVEKDDAPYVFRNLFLLLEHVEQNAFLTPQLMVRAIKCINFMATQNVDLVRTKMKDNGLFLVRDNLVLHCIRDDMPVDHRIDTFRNVSFEMIGTSPKFKEAQALLYILKLFHDCNNNTLRLIIADIVRNQLGEHDDNRKGLFKIFQDAEVLALLWPHMDPEDFRSPGLAACFPLLTTPAPIEDDKTKDKLRPKKPSIISPTKGENLEGEEAHGDDPSNTGNTTDRERPASPLLPGIPRLSVQVEGGLDNEELASGNNAGNGTASVPLADPSSSNNNNNNNNNNNTTNHSGTASPPLSPVPAVSSVERAVPIAPPDNSQPDSTLSTTSTSTTTTTTVSTTTTTTTTVPATTTTTTVASRFWGAWGGFSVGSSNSGNTSTSTSTSTSTGINWGFGSNSNSTGINWGFGSSATATTTTTTTSTIVSSGSSGSTQPRNSGVALMTHVWLSTTIEEFMQWYFSEAQQARRLAIQSRIDKAFLPVQASYRKTQEKHQGRRSKVLKQRLAKLMRSQTVQSKMVQDIVEKAKMRFVGRCTRDWMGKALKAHEARAKRHKDAELAWQAIIHRLKAVCKDLPLQVKVPAPVALTTSTTTAQVPSERSSQVTLDRRRNSLPLSSPIAIDLSLPPRRMSEPELSSEKRRRNSESISISHSHTHTRSGAHHSHPSTTRAGSVILMGPPSSGEPPTLSRPTTLPHSDSQPTAHSNKLHPSSSANNNVVLPSSSPSDEQQLSGGAVDNPTTSTPKCGICAEVFGTRWDLLCHSRLDH